MLIFVVFIICCIYSDEERFLLWTMIFYTSFSIADIALLLTSAISVVHIHCSSKAIVNIGVKTDSRLMKIYALSWFCLILLLLGQVAVGLCIIQVWDKYYWAPWKWWPHDDAIYSIRLQISFEYLFVVVFTFLNVLNLLILLAYYRLGKKKS